MLNVPVRTSLAANVGGIMMTPKRAAPKPRDLNELATRIVDEATDETPPVAELGPVDDGKDPAAVALGRKGGKKGGPARAQALSPEQRSAIAKKAATARWNKRDES